MFVFGGQGVGVALVKEFAKAEFTIEILSYLFLAPRATFKQGITTTIFSIFSKKLSEGVTISILLNDKFPNGWIKIREEQERRRLRELGANVKTYPRKNILHSKLAIIDRKTALVGSVNLTAESMTKNHEILLKIDEEKAVKRLAEIFYDAWKQS